MSAEELRKTVIDAVRQFYSTAFPEKPFTPGESPVPVSGRVFDSEELEHLVDSSLDFWLTTGRYAEQFESSLASYFGLRHALLCNSGSSANLLAVSALTSQALGENRLQPGDEVITVAAGFPTTVAPLVQNGLVPVFVDVDLETYNVDVDRLEDALSSKTRAVILAHTLGNPFDLEVVTEFARQHHLFLIEDNCDALGSTYDGRLTGTFGDLATLSFYPAHHITMGEGGCVVTNKPRLNKLVESFRDWGRACWCAPGVDNTCGKRFGFQLGGLPCGYDHKYTYSHLGYNLKVTDMQAAIGVAQLQKLDEFVSLRKRNFQLLYDRVAKWTDYFILPKATPKTDPSWFGFPLTVRENAPFDRISIVRRLEAQRIGTRQLFAGNLTKQPAMRAVNYRTAGGLGNTDVIMTSTFWLGVYPGLSAEMIHFVGDTIDRFCVGSATSTERKAS